MNLNDTGIRGDDFLPGLAALLSNSSERIPPLRKLRVCGIKTYRRIQRFEIFDECLRVKKVLEILELTKKRHNDLALYEAELAAVHRLDDTYQDEVLYVVQPLSPSSKLALLSVLTTERHSILEPQAVHAVVVMQIFQYAAF